MRASQKRLVDGGFYEKKARESLNAFLILLETAPRPLFLADSVHHTPRLRRRAPRLQPCTQP